MTSYAFWTAQAKRWQNSVDFGSPISAWTTAMHAEYKKAMDEGRRPCMSNVKRPQASA